MIRNCRSVLNLVKWVLYSSFFLLAISVTQGEVVAGPLPAGEIKFRFEAYANNVKVLPPLVADFQLGVSRISGSGIIKDGKVTGTLNDTDMLRRGTRSMQAKIIGGTYEEDGATRRLKLIVEITASSHPQDEAAPGVRGTLVLQDSSVLLSNKQPNDFVAIGEWNGEVRTHIHGWNNEDPGPRTEPKTGGKGGGQWADVEISRPVNSGLAGLWRTDWGNMTLHVHAGNITGSWDQGGGKIGRITGGTFDPVKKVLTFKYYQDWNKQNGSAELKLSDDGKKLFGTWKQGSGSGTWTMTR